MAKKERPIKGAPTAKDYKAVHPDWCPGCGDFGVLNALQNAYAKLGRGNHDHLTVSGIGCSSNLPGYVNTYGMHTLHGRALPVATGAKFANHHLNVVVTGGDGDGYGIGGNHFLHTMRKNVDLLYIVMNNETYGLTVGQASPTTQMHEKTKSTPFGNLETPLNPVAMAIVGGATYVARAISSDGKELAQLMFEGMNHKGFAFIDVISPCVTWKGGAEEIFLYWKERVNALENHDTTDMATALAQAIKTGHETQLGLFYHDTSRPSLDQMEPVLKDGPMVNQPIGVTPEQGASILQRMM